MQYSHSIEKANKFAGEALERMQKEALPPTPENFELWYVYYSAMNADVTRAIDILEAANQKITLERCQEIHQRFLSDRNQNEEVQKVGDKINETIKDVTGVVSNVKDAAAEYNKTLSGVTDKLGDEVSQEQIEALLQDIVAGTQDMLSQNQALEEKLSQSSQAMQELQHDLEVARQEALTDGLTNLANRKAFDAEIERVIHNAKENGETFSVIMLDIDHFKAFNDNYGHQVGDQVLRLVAKTLTDGVKGRDMAARYGGEEFVIILPQTNLPAADTLAENLCQAVAKKEVVNRNSGEKLGRITLSGGVAEYSVGEDIEDLIERADAALYTAKNNGRNQIVAAPAPGQSQKTG